MRKDILFTKTYNLLKNLNVPFENVYIFVANYEEEEEYKAMGFKCEIVVSYLGIVNARNYVIDYFPEGQKILYLDDDISAFKILDQQFFKDKSKPTSHKMSEAEFIPLFNSYFDEIEKRKLFIFGVYPVANAMFMRLETTYDLRFLCGGAFGIINRKNVKNSITLGDNKEDFLRSLQYFLKDGESMRVNKISMVTSIYKGKGGLNNQSRGLKEKSSCDWLLENYPQFFELKKPKKNSLYSEIKFKQKKIYKDILEVSKKNGLIDILDYNRAYNYGH
jgi:hypothetical protein